MSLLQQLAAYAGHHDPVAAACNRIALLVASSQVTWPFYVVALAGHDGWIACATYGSTPFFVAVPYVARRLTVAGAALLVMAGVGNAMVATKALGAASGLELFLIPTLLIGWFALRGHGFLLASVVAAHILALLGLQLWPSPWRQLDPVADAQLLHLNMVSATVLCVIIATMLRGAQTDKRRGDGQAVPQDRAEGRVPMRKSR
ncbi:MAG: hypothetical protein KGJ57_01820 [Sphingomonadales bacterium]|nr:hypothetical protein [Sphingomonadales bacterium]MDE2168147.1 hypothetical protein [Sphingomonadales bacterium]